MRFTTVVLLLSCLTPGAWADFVHHPIDTGSGYVRTVADVNGDGLPDIVAVAGNDGVCWYEYPTWTKHILAGANFDFACDDLVPWDMDGDGDLDIVGAHRSDGEGRVVVLMNPLPGGDPRQEWGYIPVGNAGQIASDDYVKNLGIADYDRDGYVDVAARTHQYTYVFVQNSDGSWTQVKRIDLHPPEEGLAVADLDVDGNPDLIMNGFWLRNPHPSPLSGTWTYFEIDPTYHDEGVTWPNSAAKVAVADVDGNGELDVLFTDAEQDPVLHPVKADPIAWYSAADPTGTWTRHVIDASLGEAHTLQVADIDFDGDLDFFTGQMSDGGQAPVRVYYNGGGASSWSQEQISNNGIYSGAMGDVDRDGDMDLVGVQDWNDLVLELFENTVHDGFTLDSWQYIRADYNRAEYSWAAYLGLAIADLTHDGLQDIVSGKYFYRNTGGDMLSWPRVEMPLNVDASLIVDVDGDRFGDVIGMAESQLYWLEANTVSGSSWSAHPIQTVVPGNHDNSQGYALAQVVPGGRAEIVMAFGDGTWYLEIPTDPEAGDWPKTHIRDGFEGEGIALGYVDSDRFPDLVAAYSAQEVAWYRNPGNGAGDWQHYDVGVVGNERADRFSVADIDRDGNSDIVVSTEEYPDSGEAYLYWFEAPDDPVNQSWTRHQIPTGENHDSLNSLDVADMDSDGDLDIITGEVFGDLETTIWENDGTGQFTRHLVDRGKESHLGARVADLDNDGDQDIVSIAWYESGDLHVWRNDCFTNSTQTPIYLVFFSAERQQASALLSWSISYLRQHRGLHVWRQQRDQERERLTGELLLGELTHEYVDPEPPAGSAEYWLQEIADDGTETWLGPATLEPAGNTPENLAITGIFPNPFNPHTTIRYTLPRAGQVLLAVYDSRGRRVRTLVQAHEEAGERTVVWDGQTDGGATTASGVYFARLVTDQGVQNGKMVLTK